MIKRTRYLALLAFALGLGLGWGGSRLLPSSDSAPPARRGDTDTLHARIAEQENALRAATLREIELYNRIDALERGNSATTGLADQAASRAAATEAEDERRAAQREQRQLERQEREARDFALRLGADERQQAGLARALAARDQARREWFEARRRGESGGVDPDAVFRAELTSVLTPEQLAAYDEYETKVMLSRAETGATARMNAIAPQLDLSEAQKDAVYATYYEDLVTRRGPDAPEPSARAAEIEAAMRDILTPEQFSRWQEEESRRGRGWF